MTMTAEPLAADPDVDIAPPGAHDEAPQLAEPPVPAGDLLPAVATAQRTASLFDTYKALAIEVAPTEFVPKVLRSRPAAVLACILTGHELGIGPMRALQHINIVEGKPTQSAELMRARIQEAGHQWRTVTKTHERVVLRGRRKENIEDPDAWVEIEWTLDDAVKAGLCSIKDGKPWARSSNGKPLPWENYTRMMLMARATSELARDEFADVLGGVSYTPEELGAQVIVNESGIIEVLASEVTGDDDDGDEKRAKDVAEWEALRDTMRARTATLTPEARGELHEWMVKAGFPDKLGEWSTARLKAFHVELDRREVATVEQIGAQIGAVLAAVPWCSSSTPPDDSDPDACQYCSSNPCECYEPEEAAAPPVDLEADSGEDVRTAPHGARDEQAAGDAPPRPSGHIYRPGEARQVIDDSLSPAQQRAAERRNRELSKIDEARAQLADLQARKAANDTADTPCDACRKPLGDSSVVWHCDKPYHPDCEPF